MLALGNGDKIRLLAALDGVIAQERLDRDGPTLDPLETYRLTLAATGSKAAAEKASRARLSVIVAATDAREEARKAVLGG